MNMNPGKFPLPVAMVLLLAAVLHIGCEQRSPTGPNQQSVAPAPVPLTNMVLIPAGSFIRAKHRVTISRDFWLAKFEVTQAEYAALRGKNPSYFLGDLQRPVEKVSHVDAVAYCSALTQRERQVGRLPPGYEYRLPSEAEWEYACRAGTTNFFSFGDATAEADPFAWTQENSQASTHPVGQKRPNPWGLHDIHGNVWEWCLDWFGEYPAMDVTDPVGPARGKFKVFRGGGWNNEAQFARSANRFMMAPSNSIYFVGFRISLSRTETSPR
jgi:formylglycine-generating enzyme required for sulfatase activity